MDRMKWLRIFGLLLLIGLTACGAQPTSAPTNVPPTQALPSPTATGVPPTEELPSPTRLPPTSTRTPIQNQIPADDFPLSQHGPYQFKSLYGTIYQDQERGGRQVAVTITYPVKDGAPDRSGAPYPVIVNSTINANIFGDNLTSYGFVVVGINNIDSYYIWDENLVDQPLDILFALDQVASNPPELLKGMFDTDHAGAMGYSFDGYNTLAMSGARVDPEWIQSRCANPPALPPIVVEFGTDFYCNIVKKWTDFANHAGNFATTGTDGLWQPMTDVRLRAFMPMAPEGTWLFGERGLAAVDRPTLIIGDTLDQYCPYETEAAYIFNHLGTAERFLITFVGQDHLMIFDREQVKRMQHFSVAFFSTYLQGRQDFARFFLEEYVSQHPDLAWGVYAGQ
jgi:predicted dienelactone hydrolase